VNNRVVHTSKTSHRKIKSKANERPVVNQRIRDKKNNRTRSFRISLNSQAYLDCQH
jgi:hypothetical protein